MTTELQTFEENVKKKLMESIAGLIPEEQIEALVKSQHKIFLQNFLPSLINKELNKIYTEQIGLILNTSENYNHINGLLVASDPLKEILTKSAPEIFASMFGSMMQGVVNNLRQNLPQY